MSEKRDTESAFKWIVGLLNKHNIPFQISGGFAARLYGSDRELADIDLVMPNDMFDTLYQETKDYVTFGPARYTDRNWDLILLTMVYEGQEIDIGGTEDTRIFDAGRKEWVAEHENIGESTMLEVYGLLVPVIPRQSLIAYKRRLSREVDKADIAALEGNK